MKKTKVINLIAGPGAGKSTCAYFLTGNLKLLHTHTEYIPEFAKTLVLLKKFHLLNNQHYVSHSQYDLLKSLDGIVEYIVTDGSLFHGLYYNRSNIDNMSDVTKTEKAIWEFFNDFENINIFIERGEFDYEQTGRLESEEEAVKIDKFFKKTLSDNNISFMSFNDSPSNPKAIIDYILSLESGTR